MKKPIRTAVSITTFLLWVAVGLDFERLTTLTLLIFFGGLFSGIFWGTAIIELLSKD